MANESSQVEWTEELLRKRLAAIHNERFAWHTLGESPIGRLDKAAVLIPLVIDKGQLKVWLTERSEKVRHDRGHVSFPGGMKEAGDINAIETALREAEEEIGLQRHEVLFFSP